MFFNLKCLYFSYNCVENRRDPFSQVSKGVLFTFHIKKEGSQDNFQGHIGLIEVDSKNK